MSWLAKLTGNFISASNENNLALAHLKFDWSLVKVEAPREYSGFGEALSHRRRVDAEDGIDHRTARRLGALFEQLIPDTPHLIKAYGVRATEIAQTSNINPRGSSKDGPFESYVGADGTAMWAAATSGVPALGVYLLACLLARAWGAKEATAMWVEIVELRRKEIVSGFQNHNVVSESSRMVLYQDISRDDLARWDASARAWLQSADRAKLRQQTQLVLLIKNLQLPGSSGQSMYSQIIDSWRQAMGGLDRLIRGEPQNICNMAILCAYSAWHIYPDLIVLGKEIRQIKFEDECVNPSGVGNIGYSRREPGVDTRMTWSLALSHLRYYGDPVIVKSDLPSSRITIHQLHLVALGSLFSHWHISQRDVGPASQWFMCLWDQLRINVSDTDKHQAPEGLDWLQYFAEAASKTDCADLVIKKEVDDLVAYGIRRAKRLLGAGTQSLIPYFGLGNPCILAGLSQTNKGERGLAYLRQVAERNGLTSSDAFIGVRHKILMHGRVFWLQEFFTAVPHTRASNKRNEQGSHVNTRLHGRWLYLPQDIIISAEEDALLETQLQDRLRDTRSRGELGMKIAEPPIEVRTGEWVWPKPPLLYDFQKHGSLVPNLNVGTDRFSCPSLSSPRNACQCLDCDAKSSNPAADRTKFWNVSHLGGFELFIKKDAEYKVGLSAATGNKVPDLHPSVSSQFCASHVELDVLVEYLQCYVKTCRTDEHLASTDSKSFLSELITCRFTRPGPNQQERQYRECDYIKELASEFPSCEKGLTAVKTLAFATRIYHGLDGAMIDLRIADYPLDEASWVPEHRCMNHERQSLSGLCAFTSPISRINSLSCIVHLESGTLNFEPEVFEDTLAIASGNSLFVVGLLLSDPVDTEQADRIVRITGNIGRPGISFLVAPFEPKIRDLGSSYNLVNHVAYDGKRENNFRGTSLHLSFTDWDMPVEPKGARNGFVDQDARYVESIVSILDSGKWVADLDVLRIKFQELAKLESNDVCPGHPPGEPEYDHTSIDSWEELLDRPREVGIFRAHGNWAARLGAVSILCQKDQAQSIGLLGPEDFCIRCLATSYEARDLADYESPLPSICID